MTLGRRWFDRWLKGVPNGVDTEPPIELARDLWTGSTAAFRTSATRTMTFRFRGTSIGEDGKVVRTVRLLETERDPRARDRARAGIGQRALDASRRCRRSPDTGRAHGGRQRGRHPNAPDDATATADHSVALDGDDDSGRLAARADSGLDVDGAEPATCSTSSRSRTARG